MSDINTSTEHLIQAAHLKSIEIRNARDHKELGGKVIIKEDGTYELTNEPGT